MAGILASSSALQIIPTLNWWLGSPHGPRQLQGRAVPFIQFDLAYRQAVEAAHLDWSRKLPRRPGQISGPMTSTVEAPQFGTTVRLLVDPLFVAFLKGSSSVPFQEERAFGSPEATTAEHHIILRVKSRPRACKPGHGQRLTVKRVLRPYATVARPCRCTRESNFSDAPWGCFSPRSHWLTRPGVTLR